MSPQPSATPLSLRGSKLSQFSLSSKATNAQYNGSLISFTSRKGGFATAAPLNRMVVATKMDVRRIICSLLLKRQSCPLPRRTEAKAPLIGNNSRNMSDNRSRAAISFQPDFIIYGNDGFRFRPNHPIHFRSTIFFDAVFDRLKTASLTRSGQVLVGPRNNHLKVIALFFGYFVGFRLVLIALKKDSLAFALKASTPVVATGRKRRSCNKQPGDDGWRLPLA
mmetsp:Transcript_18459/g.30068  ORF Transcript_18459/g.30068 Transcript_18459/m.30068 type:complete len:222 (+) Transcript_18459:584-1249(+)